MNTFPEHNLTGYVYILTKLTKIDIKINYFLFYFLTDK